MQKQHIQNKNKITAIILAAGMGTRLKPLTNNIPKCMVKVAGKPILYRQIETFRALGINDIVVVAGYNEDKIIDSSISKIVNPHYKSTNMVYSLMCASDFFNGNVIVSYGDIFYSQEVLQAILKTDEDIVVANDVMWFKYWSERFANPLDDAESFRIGANNKVVEIGKKTNDLNRIQGQFIGLIKCNQSGIDDIKSTYSACLDDSESKENAWGSGRNLEMAYMTDLLNEMAGKGRLHHTPINRGWFEIDSMSDLNVAERSIGELS